LSLEKELGQLPPYVHVALMYWVGELNLSMESACGISGDDGATSDLYDRLCSVHQFASPASWPAAVSYLKCYLLRPLRLAKSLAEVSGADAALHSMQLGFFFLPKAEAAEAQFCAAASTILLEAYYERQLTAFSQDAEHGGSSTHAVNVATATPPSNALDGRAPILDAATRAMLGFFEGIGDRCAGRPQARLLSCA